MISPRIALVSGSVLAFLAVALGAFGAHALRDFLQQTQRMHVYEKAVHYQMFHALGLIMVALLGFQFPNFKTDWISTFFFLGILFFSGSLYLLCMTEVRWLGAITPFGGTSFLIGWGLLAWQAWQQFR